MIDTIYVESSVRDHPRSLRILKKYAGARVIECEHYGEVFNRKGQNFRLQKQHPALILARKQGRKIYPAPADHAIGARHNYYFSHMLNCPFDCRYCFLQGKFDSAHHVLFVNYEDYWQEISAAVNENEELTHIFSGYDCDSLAFEPVTGFVAWLLENLAPSDFMLMELRTKSTQIRQLLKRRANISCLVAYSLAPSLVVRHFEAGTAALQDRLNALAQLQKAGWPVGLRLDPMIAFAGHQQIYQAFFEQISRTVRLENVHSITLGTMRFPDPYLKKITRLYPQEALLASVDNQGAGSTGYSESVSSELIANALGFFSNHIDNDRIFLQQAAS